MIIEPVIIGLGFAFSIGVFLFIACLTILARIIGALGPKDDSDGKTRSGFTIKTDALTGVQYLLTRQGHVTVRVDSSGYPIVERKKHG
jgi:hypothetical protein